jgi:ABC-type transport system involved in cytochrome c biogenesis permease subunit
MEALKMLSITLAISFAMAGVGWLIVSVALDPLERLRQRWVAREHEARKTVSE